MQECCCGGGITVRGEVASAVGRGLCSPPGSVGYLSNQLRTMGRWVGQVPRVANLFHSNVSLIPMCLFCYWSHSLFPIAVVTGASEGIGRGYALEVSASSCCCAVS